jgi:hypothetical protein
MVQYVCVSGLPHPHQTSADSLFPPFSDPADHILDVVSTDSRPGREAESNERVSNLVSSWSSRVTKEENALHSVEVFALPATVPKEKSNLTSVKVALPVVLHRMVRFQSDSI